MRGLRALLALDGVRVPAGVEASAWEPGAAPPADLAEVQFYCGPYRKGPDPVTGHLSGMPALQVLQVLSAGVDGLLPHLGAGTTLCNGRGLHDSSTAELALALVLAAQRDLPALFAEQVLGRWSTPPPARELVQQTALVVGYGGVGAAVAARLSAVLGRVLPVASRPRAGVHGAGELPDLLPLADVVVLAVPATERTHHLVDAAFLARMRSGALLVNVARGSVVDTAALLEHVTSGRLRAALDVTDPEPLPAQHPLWSAPGVIITPHVGGGGAGALPRARDLVSRQLQHWVRGEPLENVVVVPVVPPSAPGARSTSA